MTGMQQQTDGPLDAATAKPRSGELEANAQSPLRKLRETSTTKPFSLWKPKSRKDGLVTEGSSDTCGLECWLHFATQIRNSPTSPALRRKVSTLRDSHAVQRDRANNTYRSGPSINVERE